MRKFWKIRGLCLFVGFVLFCTQSWAATTEVFVDQGTAAFQHGEFEGTVLDPFGVVRVGVGLERFAYDGVEGFSALATNGRGGVYVGSATDGKVLKFEKGRFMEFYRAPGEDDQRVTALAVTQAGVWAAFAPSGLLLRIDSKGNAAKVEGLESAYIWKMAANDDGGVTIATGLPGGLRVVNSRGKVLGGGYDIDAHHVMDFRRVDGTTWVATAMPARVIRIENQRRQTILFELGTNDEALAMIPAPGGGVYAITNQGAPTAKARASKKKKATPGKGEGATPEFKSAMDAFGPSSPAPKPLKATKGAALWHVDGRGASRLIRSLGSDPVLSGASLVKAPLVERVGGVVVGMSKMGRALSLNDDGAASVLLDTAETSVPAMALSERGEGYLVTSGGAALYRVARSAKKAVYLSPVRDASVAVYVGRVDWVGEGVRVEVRTGTTRVPIEGSWSNYAPVSALGGVPKVPAGRFLQYRVVLASSAASLRALRIAYRAPNRSPVVRSVEFADRKTKVSSSESSSKGKRAKGLRKAKKVLSSVKAKRYTGIKRIAFNVQDEDGDALRFDVRARQLGSSHWTRLTPERGVEEPYVDWVVADYPDGRYEVEVISSDVDTNPPGEGLSGRTVSQPILIDNHPPEIRSVRVISGRLEFSVRDMMSPLKNVTVAVDGGPWQILAPVDGIVDGKEEKFVVPLKALRVEAPALIRIGVEDSFGHRRVEGVNAR